MIYLVHPYAGATPHETFFNLLLSLDARLISRHPRQYHLPLNPNNEPC